MGLYKFVRSKGYKNFMTKLYGWGASLVILGALFKIQHYPGAGVMLMLGMCADPARGRIRLSSAGPGPAAVRAGIFSDRHHQRRL